MKRFEKVQERIQKYSIRKLSVGVGSVAIAALIFGSSLSSSTVAADEVGGGATAHYTYVEEQELTEQEKGLIKKGLPENLQTGENYYLIYRKQDGKLSCRVQEITVSRFSAYLRERLFWLSWYSHERNLVSY